jgi:cell fate (sporulation/competence/biofilm development) regulator YlbF (YheA/YmcA/DUF963 family)
LGDLILSSDEAKKLHAARQAFDENTDAKKKFDEYSAFQRDVQQKASGGDMDEETFADATKKLMQMAAELKQDDTISKLMDAENGFNGFVNSVMNVLRFTITGVDASDACGCHGCAGGDCNSCE